MKHVPEAVVLAAQQFGRLSGPELTTNFSKREVVVLCLGKPVARLAPDRIRVATQIVRGDFLRDGDHWSQARSLIDEAVAHMGADASAATATAASIDASELDDEVIDACTEASKGIRLNRTAAFSNPVELFFRGGSIRFEPITDQPRLSVPFLLTLDDDPSVRGRLALRGGDPLAVSFSGFVEPSLASRGHALVLLGFATLTVLPLPEDRATASRAPRSAASHSGRADCFAGAAPPTSATRRGSRTKQQR